MPPHSPLGIAREIERDTSLTCNPNSLHWMHWKSLSKTLMDRTLPTLFGWETCCDRLCASTVPCKQIIHSNPPEHEIRKRSNDAPRRNKYTNESFHGRKTLKKLKYKCSRRKSSAVAKQYKKAFEMYTFRNREHLSSRDKRCPQNVFTSGRVLPRDTLVKFSTQKVGFLKTKGWHENMLAFSSLFNGAELPVFLGMIIFKWGSTNDARLLSIRPSTSRYKSSFLGTWPAL